MELFSMTQFKKYCDEHAGAVFTYDSRNDVSRICTSFCYATDSYNVFHIGYYDKVICMLNPNRICFKNQYTAVTFNNIEQIIIDREYLQGISDIINIICKGNSTRHIILVNTVSHND